MKNTIKDLAQKYDVQSIINRLELAENSKTIKIGFIGEFSSGKTSLINSVLGTKLPVDINPCTKAITIIEPTEGIEEGKINYFIEKGEERTFVNFTEFSQIANGGEVGVCGIQIPPCKVLPQGCVFIDTPGIHSVGGDEAALTYGYLSFLDAAVFCIDATEGTINDKTITFLKKDVPSIIHNRIVFVLTHSEFKDNDEIKVITKHISDTLSSNLGVIKNLDNKFLAVNNNENNSSKLYDFLKISVLSNHIQMIEDRQKITYKEIGNNLLDILSDKKKMLNYNSDEIEDKIIEIEEHKKELENAKREQKNKLNRLKTRLESSISSYLSAHRSSYENVTSSEELAVINNTLFPELLRIINDDVMHFFKGEYEVPNYVLSEAASLLKGRIEEIIKTRDIAVSAITMIATSVILPATGLLGNAGEAAAGGAVIVGGRELAKKTSKKVAKEAVKKIAKETGEEAIKNGFLSSLGNIVGTIGGVIRDVNPVEWLGDIFAKGYKREAVKNIVDMSPIIANNIINIIEPIFEENIYQPLLDKETECSKTLSKMRKQLDKGLSDYNDKILSLSADINALKAVLS